jgi:hypothetical protein
LPYAANLVLTLTDVKDLAGNPLTTSLAFRTDINAPQRIVVLGEDQANPIYEIYQYKLDAAGLPNRRLRLSPGMDNTWLTPDDQVSDRFDVVYGADGKLQREASYSAGPDSKYDTSDDVLNEIIPVAYDAQGKAIDRAYSSDPGVDMTFGTADDPLVFLISANYTGPRLTGSNLYNSSGPDGVWRTSDDKCNPGGGGSFLQAGIWTYAYDASGRKASDSHANCGADGIPRNGDDVRDISIDFTYDANGELIRLDARSGPGADNMWNTPDDSRFMVHKVERDPSGLPVRQFTYTSAGPDAIWDTADDTPGAIYSPGFPVVEHQFEAERRVTYDPTSKLVTEATVYNGAGVDGLWGTDDDEIERYTVFSYDALGKRIDRKTYVAGTDGLWHTADDRLVVDTDFDTLH